MQWRGLVPLGELDAGRSDGPNVEAGIRFTDIEMLYGFRPVKYD